MTTFITKERLSHYLNVMVELETIAVPDEKDAWLRIITKQECTQGERYSISNGCGDGMLIWILPEGAFIKGFDHENELNQFAADEWDEEFFEYTYKDVPEVFIKLLEDDEKDETTFCMWCCDDTDMWNQNEMADNDGGKEYLLGYIMQSAQQWYEWAVDYHETDIDFAVVEEAYKKHGI